MSKKAIIAALKAYPKETRDKTGFITDIGYPQFIRDYYIQGYEQAEKETIERAINVLYEQIDDLIYSHLTIGDFLEKFRKTMEK